MVRQPAGEASVSDKVKPDKPKPAVPRLALSVDEAAVSIGVSRDFLEEHVLSELRMVRRGRRRLIPVRELERWLLESAARTLGG